MGSQAARRRLQPVVRRPANTLLCLKINRYLFARKPPSLYLQDPRLPKHSGVSSIAHRKPLTVAPFDVRWRTTPSSCGGATIVVVSNKHVSPNVGQCCAHGHYRHLSAKPSRCPARTLKKDSIESRAGRSDADNLVITAHASATKCYDHAEQDESGD
jgi:hypothetical protein